MVYLLGNYTPMYEIGYIEKSCPKTSKYCLRRLFTMFRGLLEPQWTKKTKEQIWVSETNFLIILRGGGENMLVWKIFFCLKILEKWIKNRKIQIWGSSGDTAVYGSLIPFEFLRNTRPSKPPNPKIDTCRKQFD